MLQKQSHSASYGGLLHKVLMWETSDLHSWPSILPTIHLFFYTHLFLKTLKWLRRSVKPTVCYFNNYATAKNSKSDTVWPQLPLWLCKQTTQTGFQYWYKSCMHFFFFLIIFLFTNCFIVYEFWRLGVEGIIFALDFLHVKSVLWLLFWNFKFIL